MKNHLYLLLSLLFVTSTQIHAQVFTDTQGQLNISNSGTASYTLPIALPPSIQNVGPVINLNYNSGQLGGIAGQGWNISGISSIHRIATRKDIDGYIDGVDFDDNDKLALDGQRLILKTGNYWENGSTYETEVQSNTRIELRKENNAIYFIVNTADGNQMWYGNYQGSNASDLTAYYIVRQEDVNGNYISYTYETINNALYVKGIGFSGNISANVSAYNYISFNYLDANRSESAYVNGVKVTKSKILKEVLVFTQDQLFRKYVLTHIADPLLGYETVTQVQEFNGAGEGANIVKFGYNKTSYSPQTSETTNDYESNINYKEIDLSGDFDGDGRLDFIVENKLYTKLYNTTTERKPILLPSAMNFSATTLNPTSEKLNQYQSLVNYVNVDGETSKFNVYNIVNGQPILSYSKEFPLNLIANQLNVQIVEPKPYPDYPYATEYSTNILNTGFTPMQTCEQWATNKYGTADYKLKATPIFKEGDFNGDGISDVLIAVDQTKPLNYYVRPTCSTDSQFDSAIRADGEFSCCNVYEEKPVKEFYLLDLNPSSSTVLGSKGYRKIVNYNNIFQSDFDKTKTYSADFNSDGKTDLMFIQNTGYYKIMTVHSNGDTYEFVEIASGILAHYDGIKEFFISDFNGDSKPDFAVPVDFDNPIWAIYINRINTKDDSYGFDKYFELQYFDITSYRRRELSSEKKYFYFLDVNGDNKSDLVEVWGNDFYGGKPAAGYWKIDVYDNNITNKSAVKPFTKGYTSPTTHYSSPHEIVPIAAPFKYEGVLKDIIVLSTKNNKITYVDFKKNVGLDSQLKTVESSGSKIVDIITYSLLEPFNTTGNGTMSNSVYSSTESLTYPYVEIKNVPQGYVVTKLTNQSIGITKHQDFRYHGLVVNLEGMGVVGYKKTARSAWYQSSSAGKIWNVTETDPLQRGAVTRTYSQYVGSGVTFSFSDNDAPTGIINKTTNLYQSTTSPSKVYSLLLTTQVTKDYITNFSTYQYNTYEPTYNLLQKTETKKLLGSTIQSTSITENQYENNPTGIGKDYYIGRLKQSNGSVSAYSDTKKSESKYTYENNRIKKTESKANNTDNIYLTQEYTYDTFGNVLTQTTSAPGAQPAVASRTVSYTYDPSGRYIKTTTSPGGLVSTNDTYHPLYGMVTQSTSPLGLVSKSIYDNWGKVTKETDYLNRNTNYSYTRSGDKITVYKNHDTGLRSIVTSNILGQTLIQYSRAIDGVTWIKVDSKYDYLGRKTEQSEPYTTSASQWNKTVYDIYGRTKQTIAYTGKTTNYSYAPSATGFKVGVNDGIKTTSSVTNANGHTITSTDPGGTITYTYFADGNLKTSSFSGNTQSITYDDWGRKVKLVDPSAGTYTYKYNAYGETLEETTPNGVTVYTLDDFGKVTKKQNIGNNTSLTSDYTYDPTTKLLTGISLNDTGKTTGTYGYQYDEYKRLKYVSEKTAYAQFNKSITYDSFGRIYRQGYTALNLRNSKLQGTKVRVAYKNGYQWQIIDDVTSKVLWSNDTYNERGQLTQGTYGNGIKQQNQYDPFGYYAGISFNKEGQTTPLLSLGYQFNPLTANPILRTNSVFNVQEFFTYEDNFDRLTTINTTQNGVNTIQTQAYDNTGRITENSQIGSYQYGNTAKKYQTTSITLNTAGAAYANDNMKLSVSYNAFKAPVRINQKDKETLFFTYNTFEQRTTMLYGDTKEVKEEKMMRKHYSHDGLQEITDNIVTGETTFVTYIGGDGYSAPIVLKGNGTTKEYLYLHRDNQGSIMAISNDQGNIIEQRLYDAWGLITGIKDGQGNNLTKLTVLDRGYTGHEHIQGVGLIHMNGRLYDPVVHRFMGPDNFVQDPSNTQNYNRYGYVLNNPLKYTDPSGEVFVVDDLLIAMAVGAVISTFTYVAVNDMNGVPVTLKGAIKSALIGAISGAVSFGIGEAATTIANVYIRATVQAVCHGYFQGAMSVVQGGTFKSGFLSGAISSLMSSAFGADLNGKKEGLGWGEGFRTDKGAMIFFGAVTGGVGAELGGGNFWQGAATGFIVSALNHSMTHKGFDPKPKVNYKKYFSLLKQALNLDASDLVAFGITGQYRHIFGPDAIAVSGNLNGGVGAGGKIEKGALFVLRGYNANQIYAYDDFGVGAFGASASANISVTKLYYSGSSSFKHDVFMGTRYEMNLGIDVGFGIGATGIYAPLSDGSFVIGFGLSGGVGVSATAVDFNLNYGSTSRTTPWKN